jgi:hypothetical protein
MIEEEKMRRKLIVVSILGLFLGACSTPPPLPPTLTPLPLPSLDPHATSLPLSEIDLAPLLVRPGDLPDWIWAGEISHTYPSDIYLHIPLPLPDNQIQQRLQDSEGPTGWVIVLLYELQDDLNVTYDRMQSNLSGSGSSPGSPVVFEKRSLAGVGERAAQSTIDDPVVYRRINIVFTRCHAYVDLHMGNGSRFRRPDQTMDVMTAAAIEYAQRLDKRLSSVVCR